MALIRTALFAILAASLLATPEARSLRVHNSTKTAIEKTVAEVEVDDAAQQEADDRDEAEEDAADADEAAAKTDEEKDEENDEGDAEEDDEAPQEEGTDGLCGPHRNRTCTNALEHEDNTVSLVGQVDEDMEDEEAERGMPIEDAEEMKAEATPGAAKAKVVDEVVPEVEAPLAPGMEKVNHEKLKATGAYNPMTGQIESDAAALIQLGSKHDDEAEADEDSQDEENANAEFEDSQDGESTESSDDASEEQSEESEDAEEDVADEDATDANAEDAEDDVDLPEEEDSNQAEEDQSAYNLAEESVESED